MNNEIMTKTIKAQLTVVGGGFAGTALAFVPNDKLDGFKTAVEAALGKAHCHKLLTTE